MIALSQPSSLLWKVHDNLAVAAGTAVVAPAVVKKVDNHT